MSSPLPPMDLSDNPTGCCPRFHPEPWDGHEFSLEGLTFIRATTRSLLFVPLNFNAVVTRTQAAIFKAGAAPADRWLMLSRDLSLWKAEHYFLTAAPVPGFETVELHGSYHTRVFDGPFSQIGLWYKQMEQDLKARGLPLREVFAYYTTCPSCAKVYGKNYVVLMAKVLEAA